MFPHRWLSNWDSFGLTVSPGPLGFCLIFLQKKEAKSKPWSPVPFTSLGPEMVSKLLLMFHRPGIQSHTTLIYSRSRKCHLTCPRGWDSRFPLKNFQWWLQSVSSEDSICLEGNEVNALKETEKQVGKRRRNSSDTTLNFYSHPGARSASNITITRTIFLCLSKLGGLTFSSPKWKPMK